MSDYLIKEVSIVNEGEIFPGEVLIKKGRIEAIGTRISRKENITEISGAGKFLIPGVIDDHVHFREPGLTDKEDIKTGSGAAVAGGVTTFMEMPNTRPPAISLERLEEKYKIAEATSPANFSFYMGVANGNWEEVLKANKLKNRICGVKIFMGSSTGNMLVDDKVTLEKIFQNSELVIATHCEDEAIIKANLERLTKEKGLENLQPADHPVIRDVEACYVSSKRTVELAKRFGSRLHIVHITTGKELDLFDPSVPPEEKKITAEVCVHHLWFSSEDYAEYGNKIKCNPAIKSPENREALWKGLMENRLDLIATDNAPHTREEKSLPYYKAPSGIPLVQHALPMMLDQHNRGRITLEKIVDKMCHAPAVCFKLKERGFIREGYFADLALIDINEQQQVKKDNILYKCGWSPLEGKTLTGSVVKTFVNGSLVYDDGRLVEGVTGQRVSFDRS